MSTRRSFAKERNSLLIFIYFNCNEEVRVRVRVLFKNKSKLSNKTFNDRYHHSRRLVMLRGAANPSYGLCKLQPPQRRQAKCLCSNPSWFWCFYFTPLKHLDTGYNGDGPFSLIHIYINSTHCTT